MKYKKSQTGWVLIAIFAPVLGFLFLAHLNRWGNNPLPLTPFLILSGLFVFISLLFYKLTVHVEKSKIKLIYGIGLIRATFKIDQLSRAEVIKTPWYYGLGIRITPKGMLYNIHGSQAVRLEYQHKGKSKSVMIGTPEPEQLKDYLEKNFSREREQKEPNNTC